jgi:hypothetical protein
MPFDPRARCHLGFGPKYFLRRGERIEKQLGQFKHHGFMKAMIKAIFLFYCGEREPSIS